MDCPTTDKQRRNAKRLKLGIKIIKSLDRLAGCLEKSGPTCKCKTVDRPTEMQIRGQWELYSNIALSQPRPTMLESMDENCQDELSKLNSNHNQCNANAKFLKEYEYIRDGKFHRIRISNIFILSKLVEYNI